MWFRNAGARVWHRVPSRSAWVRDGRAVCGADVSRPYIESVAKPAPLTFERLAGGRMRFGQTRPCRRCERAS